jgi:hypothetical protein
MVSKAAKLQPTLPKLTVIIRHAEIEKRSESGR